MENVAPLPNGLLMYLKTGNLQGIPLKTGDIRGVLGLRNKVSSVIILLHVFHKKKILRYKRYKIDYEKDYADFR